MTEKNPDIQRLVKRRLDQSSLWSCPSQCHPSELTWRKYEIKIIHVFIIDPFPHHPYGVGSWRVTFFLSGKHPQEAYETTVTMSYPLGYAIKQKLSSVVIQLLFTGYCSSLANFTLNPGAIPWSFTTFWRVIMYVPASCGGVTVGLR